MVDLTILSKKEAILFPALLVGFGYVQLGLVIGMVLVAYNIARGLTYWLEKDNSEGPYEYEAVELVSEILPPFQKYQRPANWPAPPTENYPKPERRGKAKLS